MRATGRDVRSMSTADGILDEGPRAVPRTAAQERIIAAALGLFARYGVGGTSLQMIADEIGVTKRASVTFARRGGS